MNLKQKLVYDTIKADPGFGSKDGLENHDARLIAAVWRKEGWSDDRGLEDNIRRVTRPATIVRRKRELRQLGLIEYSEQRMKEVEHAYQNEKYGRGGVPQAIKVEMEF